MANGRVTLLFVTTLAAANGLLVETGLGILNGVVPRWIGSSPTLLFDISAALLVLVLVGTTINVLVGLGTMWDTARWLGLVSYGGAFLGGQVFLYSPMMGSIGLLLSVGLVLIAPLRTGRW